MALFEPEFGLIFWMLVVFLALFGILAKYAWPVIIRSVEERAAYIDKGVTSAREAIELKKQAEYDAQTLLTDAQRKQLEILQEAQRLKDDIVGQAKKSAAAEAQKILDAARLVAEQTKKEAEVQMRRQVGKLSLEIAGKVIRQNLDGNKAQEEMVEKYLDELENKN